MQTAAAIINFWCSFLLYLYDYGLCKCDSASREGVIELEDKSTEPMKAFIMLSSWPSSQYDCETQDSHHQTV